MPSGVSIDETGTLTYKGLVVDNRISGLMVKMYREGRGLHRMVPFFKKLMANPDFRVVDQLYDFVVHAGLVILPSGNLVVYKAVDGAYMDYRTRTFDNRVGRSVKMPRNEVDNNPDHTCSAGLHVGAFPYMKNFHQKEGHIVLCEVSPTDVVSIPVDYNNTKMRVCYYKVIAEYKNFENLDSSRITEVALNGKADFDEALTTDEQDKYLVLGLGIGDDDEDEGLPITTLGENLNWDRARQLAGSQADLYSEVRIINQRTRLVEKTYFTS